MEGQDGVEGQKERYQVDREVVSQAVDGSELAMGIMRWQKRTYIFYTFRANAKRKVGKKEPEDRWLGDIAHLR